MIKGLLKAAMQLHTLYVWKTRSTVDGSILLRALPHEGEDHLKTVSLLVPFNNLSLGCSVTMFCLFLGNVNLNNKKMNKIQKSTIQ